MHKNTGNRNAAKSEDNLDKVVVIRITDREVSHLDKVRKDRSRSDFIRELIIKRLGL